MDEYLWPARNVAEYAYCPRLFYLREIEGIHLPSTDTEHGMAVHRRVNRPSAAVDAENVILRMPNSYLARGATRTPTRW